MSLAELDAAHQADDDRVVKLAAEIVAIYGRMNDEQDGLDRLAIAYAARAMLRAFAVAYTTANIIRDHADDPRVGEIAEGGPEVAGRILPELYAEEGLPAPW